MMVINHNPLGALPRALIDKLALVNVQAQILQEADPAATPIDIFGGGAASGKAWYSTWWGVAIILGAAYGGYRYFKMKPKTSAA